MSAFISDMNLNEAFYQLAHLPKGTYTLKTLPDAHVGLIQFAGRNYFISSSAALETDVHHAAEFFVELFNKMVLTRDVEYGGMETCVFALRALTFVKPVFPRDGELESPQEFFDAFQNAMNSRSQVIKALSDHILKVVNRSNAKSFEVFLEHHSDLTGNESLKFHLTELWIRSQIQLLKQRHDEHPKGVMWTASKNAKTVYLLGSAHFLPKTMGMLPPLAVTYDMIQKISRIAFEYHYTESNPCPVQLDMANECFGHEYGTEASLIRLMNQSANIESINLETYEDHTPIVVEAANSSNPQTAHFLLSTWKLVKRYYRGDFDKLAKQIKVSQEFLDESKRLSVWDNRNFKIAESIELHGSALDSEQLLVCVGVGHFFGRNNLLDILKEKGWSISKRS